jgi:phosphonate transport system substrate-binding protein
MKSRPPRWPIILGALALAACVAEPGEDYQPAFSPEPPRRTQVYLFGVHPLHNPERLFQVYQPLVEHINRGLTGARLQLEASRNYATYDERLFGGYFHLALPNPYQTVEALRHGYHVFGKMADDHEFRGILLVRKDSDLRTPLDLKGRAVSYPAPTALAATMLPQWFLHQQGVDVLRDLDNRYVGSQESSMMNVYLGETAAGATWPPPWRAFAKERPDLAAHLEVRWETEALVNNALIARDDVPAELVAEVGTLLFDLHRHPAGSAILAAMELSRFEPADDTAYAPVRAFLERFTREVRPPR